MRYVIVYGSMILAVFSVALDRAHSSPHLGICKEGFCRFDQVADTGSSSKGGTATDLSWLVLQNPSNPFAWCSFADGLTQKGEWDRAGVAFKEAVALGPYLPPVLMRAANFSFTHDKLDDGIALTNQILRQTPVFNEILFSYLTNSRVPVRKLLGTAIPASAEPAQAWLRWVGANGSYSDVKDTWSWLRNDFLDQETSEEVIWILWRRQSFGTARDLWLDWIGSTRREIAPQLLLNSQFERSPTKSPFDWTISVPSSVGISHDQGLEIRFSGSDNSDLSIQQSTPIAPGTYQFAAEVESEGLTTDQHPFFRIVDATNAARLDVHTAQIPDTTPRTKLLLTFKVAPATQAITVDLTRSRSERFDNKISGRLHVYGVSLLPMAYGLK